MEENLGSEAFRDLTGVLGPNVLNGVIVRLNAEGEFGYLQVENSEQQFIFKLNRINELKKQHYLTSFKDIGLKIGTKVNFVIDNFDRVEAVSIMSPQS